MIRLFFKTIWNNRLRNVLLFIELFIISLVLINLTTYFTERIRIRLIKTCYDTSNVIRMDIYHKERGPNSEAPFDQETLELFKNLKLNLKSNKVVEVVSISSNASPYYSSLSGPPVFIDGEDVHLLTGNTDIDYADVMRIKPIKGRWFTEEDRGKAITPMVVSKSIENQYFKGDAIGKTTDGIRFSFEVIGVIDEFKRSNFEEPRIRAFIFNEDLKRTGDLEILIRVQPGEADNYLAKAEQEVFSVLDPNEWLVIGINSFDNIKGGEELENLQKRYVGIVLAVFVLINVLLGIIGILWYNTNLRVHEVGVKRAMGATGRLIRRQLVMENLFIGCLGLFIVAIIYLQVPDIRITKVEPRILNISVICSIGVMVLLILLSTWIPSSIAAKIRPAEALKTE